MAAKTTAELDRHETFLPAEKKVEEFRIYDAANPDRIQQRVRKHYHDMHVGQTVDFVKRKVCTRRCAVWDVWAWGTSRVQSK